MSEPACECCGEIKPIVGVASIPGVPMSIAWCRECVQSGAVPMWVCDYWAGMVNGDQTALADWTLQTILLTLVYFKRDSEEFWETAAKGLDDVEAPE